MKKVIRFSLLVLGVLCLLVSIYVLVGMASVDMIERSDLMNAQMMTKIAIGFMFAGFVSIASTNAKCINN